MRRRSFLTGTGSFIVMVAGGQVWRVLCQDVPDGPGIPVGAAFDLWRTWNTDVREWPLALVHSAILSSNAFNTQPWLFKVKARTANGEKAAHGGIELYADEKRNLGAFDPYLREMFFSLGCALENLCVTASACALTASVALPAGKLGLIGGNPKRCLAAQVELSKGTRIENELFRAIPRRHTNRNPFNKERAVPSEFVQALQDQTREEDVKLFLFQEEQDRKKIVDIIWDASRRLLANPDVSRGTKPWYRTTMEQVQTKRDGAYIGEPGAAGQSANPMSYTALMSTGRLFGIIAVRDRYDRPQTIRAGTVWQRAHLLSTARGLAARPANGAVEIIDRERQLNQEPQTLLKLAQITGDDSWQPTFMFYMGYPTASPEVSARRSLTDVIL